jgi:hypothetical protein
MSSDEADSIWPADLISDQRPGEATARQRRQAARLLELQGALAAWAVRHSLPLDHVDQAAYFTIVSTRPEQPIDQVEALAQTIFWIYVLDDFLDQHRPVSSSRQIDLELGGLLVPLQLYLGALRRAGGLRWRRSPSHSDQNLLRELLDTTSSAGRMPLDSLLAAGSTGDIAVLLGLQEGLYSLLNQLGEVWTELSGRGTMAAENQYRRMLVCRQLARTIASMRRECWWNLELASGHNSGRRLPAAYSYLRNGAISIGMYAVAAVAATLDRQRRRPPPLWSWQEALAGIDTAGRIIRLANDLDTYGRETGEGKLSSVTLALDTLGHPILGLDPESSEQVAEARQVLGATLRQLTDYLPLALESLPAESCLVFYLEHVVAFALAAYGRLDA